MSDSMSLSELMELAKMKKTRPREYEKTLVGIKEVTIDIMKMAMDVAKGMQDE